MQVQGLYRESGTQEFVTQPGAVALTKVVKDGAGKAYTMDIINSAGADRFLYVFDNNAASGTILFPPVKIPAGGLVSIEFLLAIIFNTGLTISSSSTQATYTAAGADFMLRVLYK